MSATGNKKQTKLELLWAKRNAFACAVVVIIIVVAVFFFPIITFVAAVTGSAAAAEPAWGMFLIRFWG